MRTCAKCGRRVRHGEERTIGHLGAQTFFFGRGCGCLEKLRQDLAWSAGNVRPGYGPQEKPRKVEKPAVGTQGSMFDVSAYVVHRDADKDGGSKRGESR